MIKNFLDFIFEAKVKLNVKLYYSDKFRDMLENIKKFSTVQEVRGLAAGLLSWEDKDEVKSELTFIDVTDKNDMISFTPATKLQQRWEDPEDPTLKKLSANFDHWVKNLKVVKGVSIWKEARSEVKIGKFIRKVILSKAELAAGITDATIEKFVNYYKSIWDFENSLTDRMELVSGEDIRKWYIETNYADQRGQLGQSCMRYKNCQGFFDIYVENPEVCKMLVLFSDSSKTKISGRALVWKVIDREELFMDRIYTINDSDIKLFELWAKDNGVKFISQERRELRVKLEKARFEYYPYMDNFPCINVEEKLLSTNEDLFNDGVKGWWYIRQTDGTWEEDRGYWSDYHNDFIDRDNAVWCEGVEDYLSIEEAVYLEYKDIWASPREDIAYSNYSGQSYYIEDTNYSEILDDYLWEEDSMEIQINSKGDTDYLPKESKDSLIEVEVEGKQIKTLERLLIYDPIDDEWHFRDERVDGIKIRDVIKEKLEDVEVDIDSIKKYLLESKITISMQEIMSFKDTESGSLWFPLKFDNPKFLDKFIKFLIYAYPNNKYQKRGLIDINEMEGDSNRDKKIQLKAKIFKFDIPFFRELVGEDPEELLVSQTQDITYSLLKLSSNFISKILADRKIYAMWLKWKFSKRWDNSL